MTNLNRQSGPNQNAKIINDSHDNWSMPQRLNRTANYSRVSHCYPERPSHRRDAADLLINSTRTTSIRFGAGNSPDRRQKMCQMCRVGSNSLLVELCVTMALGAATSAVTARRNRVTTYWKLTLPPYGAPLNAASDARPQSE
jgi:hypothetical protein